MPTLNLGILAHVDAGKTSLTERLLYAAGAIRRLGGVDTGDTQTDTLALERQRGITIRSAVASFAIGEVTVNLIDTPGHPDFIAEVERVLGVLDGAALVVSAVEGVQPQTRILMRALRRLRIPTVFFVNKIDRPGARADALVRDLAAKLEARPVAMGAVRSIGRRDAAFVPYEAGDAAFAARLAEALGESDEAILSAWLDGATPPLAQLRRAFVAQTARAEVQPLFFGSAITGAGVEPLIAGLAELLPAASADAGGPPAARVFKVERSPSGEKVAYARIVSGSIRAREKLRLPGGGEAKVTAIAAFQPGGPRPAAQLRSGQIGKLWGLAAAQVGDALGAANAGASPRAHFAPPTLEAVVAPVRPAQRVAMGAALAQLAEQDPLIALRQDDTRSETFVSLYGEVQK
ncbi:MAG: GTP-binding protein, partial [Caulobacteraceae bacterium]